MVTGVKSGRQCPICQVKPNERENLLGKWPARTHESTRQQIAEQTRTRIAQADDFWVHPVSNFAWNHALVNIHSAMTVDILH